MTIVLHRIEACHIYIDQICDGNIISYKKIYTYFFMRSLMMLCLTSLQALMILCVNFLNEAGFTKIRIGHCNIFCLLAKFQNHSV